MSQELTFKDVFEEHRIAVGAESVHFSLAPGATPEGLARSLETIRATSNRYNSFTELERKEAEIHRLRGVISKTISRSNMRHDSSREDMSERLSEIFLSLDMVPDVDLDVDTRWMIARREKKGLSLPVGF